MGYFEIKGAIFVKKRKKVVNSSGKGNLVKGYIPPMPISVLEIDVFRKELGSMLKHNSGVYVLYKNRKLYYVGIAKDLFWRLHGHTKNGIRVFRVKKLKLLKAFLQTKTLCAS